MKTDRLENLQIGHSHTNLSFQFHVPKSLKYLKINLKTIAHVNIWYIYTR